MIFHKANLEPVVQQDDMTRINAGASFVSANENGVTLIRISPDNGVNWFDVTGATSSPSDWFLDWAYATPGTQTVKVEITTGLTPATEKDFGLEVLSIEDDCLFSDDTDLVKFEPEILCYLRRGRSSFLDVHRCAQKIILDYLNLNIRVDDCNYENVPRKLTCTDLADKQEVKTWSIYQTLVIIYEGLSDQKDDVFDMKSNKYYQLMAAARSRAEVTVDYNKDGKVDKAVRLRSARITRKG